MQMANVAPRDLKEIPIDEKPVRLAKPQRCSGCGAMVIKVPCQFCQAKRADELGRQRRRLERRLADPFDEDVRAALDRIVHADPPMSPKSEKKRPKPR